MATYEVTSPDGQVFEITAPADASEDQVMSYAQEQFSQLPVEQEAEQPEQAPLYGGGITSKLRAGLAGAGDIATFGFGDEMKAGLQAGVRGAIDPNVTTPQAYEHFLNKARQEGEQLQQENPKSYLGGQVVGGLGAALSAPAAVGKGVTALAGKTLPRQMAALGGVGGVSGGAYGFGGGEGGVQERLADVPASTAYGVAGGMLGAGVSKVAGGLAERAISAFKRKPTQAIAKGLDPDTAVDLLAQGQEVLPSVKNAPSAVNKVGRQLKRDFGENLDAALELYKRGDISLAELYGKRTSSLAQGAAVYPAGRAVAEDFLGKKTAGSYERVLGNIRKNISGVDSYYTNADDLVNIGRAKAAPLYEKAYATEVELSPKLSELLSRPAGKQALIKADKIAANEGIDLGDNKNTMVLDYIKRGFDDVLDKYRDTTTGKLVLDTNGRAIESLRRDYVEELKNLNPTYAEALAKSSDYLSIQDVMNKGRKALKTDGEVLEKTFKSMGEQEKQAYKIGLGKAIRDEIGKVNEGANPYKKILGSPEKQKRISSILSPKEYDSFERGLRAEDRLFTLRNKVLSGSNTADKLEAQKLIESGAIDSLSGVPQRTFTEALKTFKTKLLDGMNENTAAKISDILYETDPIKKLQIIDGLKGSKDFSLEEKELVKRAYSLIAPKYDSLKLSPVIAGGAVTSQMKEEK